MQTIKEKIRQRRRQMLVHSYIYYELDDNIVSDTQWAKWAKELEQLQKDYPKESAEVEEYEQFKDWDGSSGAFLNFGENIKTIAKILLEQKNCSEMSKTIHFVSDSTKKFQKSKVKSNTRSLF
jgi:NAD-dependent DNA ligase